MGGDGIGSLILARLEVDYTSNSTRALTDDERAHWSRWAAPG
jgi:hypothetical protein